jgi:hypothetical protein
MAGSKSDRLPFIEVSAKDFMRIDYLPKVSLPLPGTMRDDAFAKALRLRFASLCSTAGGQVK